MATTTERAGKLREVAIKYKRRIVREFVNKNIISSIEKNDIDGMKRIDFSTLEDGFIYHSYKKEFLDKIDDEIRSVFTNIKKITPTDRRHFDFTSKQFNRIATDYLTEIIMEKFASQQNVPLISQNSVS